MAQGSGGLPSGVFQHTGETATCFLCLLLRRWGRGRGGVLSKRGIRVWGGEAFGGGSEWSTQGSLTEYLASVSSTQDCLSPASAQLEKSQIWHIINEISLLCRKQCSFWKACTLMWNSVPEPHIFKLYCTLWLIHKVHLPLGFLFICIWLSLYFWKVMLEM